MTTSNDDQTTQLPEFDVTTPLPTTIGPYSHLHWR